jgi:hypothetical protein
MAVTVTILIPSQDTSPVNLAYNQPFQFKASSDCNLCFTKNTLFPILSGGSFSTKVNQVMGPYNAPSQDTSIDFNAVPPMQQCTVNADTTRTIHVTSTGV